MVVKEEKVMEVQEVTLMIEKNKYHRQEIKEENLQQ